MNASGVTELLERLGLTEYEAKTLSSLFRLKESEAPEVSRIAQVPKTRVYDVLDRLVKKGLIIEIYGRPKKYRVIDASDVFEGLLNKKKQEITNLEAEANVLKPMISEFQTINRELGEKVMKVKDRQDYVKILSQEIGNASQEVIAFTELRKENELLKNALRDAAGKKVSVKIVSHIEETNKAIARELSRHGVDLKMHKHGLSAFIIDGKKVILGLSDFNKENPEYHFAIWDSHEGISQALKTYFSHCWAKGKPSK